MGEQPGACEGVIAGVSAEAASVLVPDSSGDMVLDYSTTGRASSSQSPSLAAIYGTPAKLERWALVRYCEFVFASEFAQKLWERKSMAQTKWPNEPISAQRDGEHDVNSDFAAI